MAKSHGPEEFFEAFRHAERPKKALHASVAPKQEEPTPGPSEPAGPPERTMERPTDENVLTVKYSTVGALVIIIVLLMGLSYLAGVERGKPADIFETVGTEPPSGPAVDVGSGAGGSPAPVGNAGGTGSAPAKSGAGQAGTSGGSSAAPAKPVTPASRYELRMVAYDDTPRLRKLAQEQAKAIAGEFKAKGENVDVTVRKIGDKVVIGLVPFESSTDERAKRLKGMARSLKHEGRLSYKDAYFVKLSRD